MKNKISREESIAITIAHAINRSEELEHLDSLSILMEFREWICEDPIKDDIWTILNPSSLN